MADTKQEMAETVCEHCIACDGPADHAHKGGYSMCGACCGLMDSYNWTTITGAPIGYVVLFIAGGYA